MIAKMTFYHWKEGTLPTEYNVENRIKSFEQIVKVRCHDDKKIWYKILAASVEDPKHTHVIKGLIGMETSMLYGIDLDVEFL